MKWLWPTAAIGAGCLAYGALFEVDHLVGERKTLRLPGWPRPGFRVGFMADLHVQDRTTIALTLASVEWLLEQNPDLILIGGDFVPSWTAERADMLRFCLARLGDTTCPIVAVPGNRDHLGQQGLMDDLCQELGIKVLRNDDLLDGGLRVVGLDSFAAGCGDAACVSELEPAAEPTILLLHEPDAIDMLPRCAHLALAGHSHGGQFLTPWGWAPKKTRLGAKYVRGFYPQAPVPLYVSRGLGTTGPPSRLFCPPEVTLLRLEPS